MKIKDLTYIALLTAFLCITAPLSLPIGTVPVTLASFSVFLISAIAGKKGTLAVVLYILLGTSGLPVFSGFTGGFQQLAGVTGGFLVGYIFASLFISVLSKERHSVIICFVVMLTANLIIYVSGVMWFVYSTKTEFLPALTICVFPFVIPDIIKTVLAAYISLNIRKRLEKAIKMQ